MKKMMRRGMVAALLATVLLMTGCIGALVPRTTVKGTIAGEPFKIVTPKDSEVQGFKVACHTNGEVTVEIQSLKARVNPEVVSSTGTAQAAVFTAAGELFEKGMKAGISAAAKTATNGVP